MYSVERSTTKLYAIPNPAQRYWAIYHAKDADWKYFVSSNKVLQSPGLSKEGSERNREAFVNIGKINSMKILSQVKRQLKNQVRVAILEG